MKLPMDGTDVRPLTPHETPTVVPVRLTTSTELLGQAERVRSVYSYLHHNTAHNT